MYIYLYTPIYVSNVYYIGIIERDKKNIMMKYQITLCSMYYAEIKVFFFGLFKKHVQQRHFGVESLESV